MQIHGPSDEADGSTFTARLNTTGDEPFAVVEMGHVHFFIRTPDECDAAIRVWAEAKRLLLAAQDAPAVIAGPEHGLALDGTDCGCGLGAARCRELEDGA